MTVATVSQKGWVVIPAELRRKYDLRPGARVVVVDYGGVLSLIPALSDPVAEASGILKVHRPAETCQPIYAQGRGITPDSLILPSIRNSLDKYRLDCPYGATPDSSQY